MAKRENIVLSKGLEHIFNQGNIGKYKIVAHKGGTDGSQEEHIYAFREIRIIDPTPVGDIIPGTAPVKAFITGTDTQYLSILYNLESEYEYTVDELNAAAYTYIKDWNSMVSDEQKIPVSDEPDKRPVYFGEDSGGIFALLFCDEHLVSNYDENMLYISGDSTYIKAYIRGTCSIIDIDHGTENDIDMVSSIAYPLTFRDGNKWETYLFINSSIQLLQYINTATNTFISLNSDKRNTYINCSAPNTLLVEGSLSNCQKNSNYILKFATISGDLYKINTTLNPLNVNKNKTAMMISGGTARNLIIPETVKKISHFYSGGNVDNIILPSSLIEIGESAFECISGGSIALREYNDNLETIGKRAFADSINVHFFEYDINQYKTFIINNVCSNNGSYYPILNLDREQLSNVLDELLSKSIKSICLLPRVNRIREEAFYNADINTSIQNVIFSNIHTSVGRHAFMRSGIKNIIIPDMLVARPESSEQYNTIVNLQLLYLPERAIDVACRDLSSNYTYNMADNIQVQKYDSDSSVQGGYVYNKNDTNLTWLKEDKYSSYKEHAQKQAATFADINLVETQNYYFIHRASE